MRDLGTGPSRSPPRSLGWDFIYYWNHRFMHESRYMWAIHVVHHSSERYNLSTALRQPVADAFGTFAPYGLLCLFGIRPSLVFQARGINLLYQYWIHTDTIRRIGPFEQVLNTPSHHRVHHGVNPRVHRPQPRQHPHRVGQAVRHVRAESGPGGLRADEEHQDVRPPHGDDARARGHAARRRRRVDRGANASRSCVRGPGWAYRRHTELAAEGAAA